MDSLEWGDHEDTVGEARAKIEGFAQPYAAAGLEDDGAMTEAAARNPPPL